MNRWHRITVSAAVTALLGLALFVPTAVGVTAPDPGGGEGRASDRWGPQGALTTDSAVTVRWDNVGNTAANTVPRDSTQRLWHTENNSKTYADVDPTLNARYREAFTNMSVTVGQTRDLTGQAVSVTISGVKGGTDDVDAFSAVTVMQCSGLVGPDGTAASAAAGPDPARCVYGAGGIGHQVSEPLSSRAVGEDPLVKKGDWDRTIPWSPGSPLQVPAQAPFIAADGGIEPGRPGTQGPELDGRYFNLETTNEYSEFRLLSGTSELPFRVDSTIDQPALGCGVRAGAPTSERCWLVIVPRDLREWSPLSAVAPSVWAQRLQVELAFQPIGGFCPSDKKRVLTAGSEMLGSAFASWLPALCTSAQVPVGYSLQGDIEARSKLGAGAQAVALTSEPAPGATHAPIGIAAPVIAYNIDDHVVTGPATDGGYPPTAYTGRSLPQLRLTPRLVAKLLTQSYQLALNNGGGITGERESVEEDIPWFADYRPKILSEDPEFISLNPRPTYVILGSQASTLTLENLRGDAAAQVWRWLLADRDARAFLNGCPDPNGNVVNPFYSTRSYAECPSQAGQLEQVAQAWRASTAKPSTYVDQPVAYPGDGASFPQPDWIAAPGRVRDALGVTRIDPDVDPLSVNAQFPRVGTMLDVARDIETATKRFPEWCTYLSADCSNDVPPESKGIWKVRKNRENVGSRWTMGITDSATAARYTLPTAQLCASTDPKSCVGATATTLQAAAGTWQPAPGSADAPQPTGIAAPGAYPLAMPVYAAINTALLGPEERPQLAGMLDYIATAGQVPGTKPGQLPPGYAPITAAMTAQTKAVAAALRAPKAAPATTPPATSGPPAGAPPSTGTPLAPPPAAPPDAPPTAPPLPAGPPPPVAAPPPATAQQAAEGSPRGATPLSSGWFAGGLLGLLGAGLASAAVSPILERRSSRSSAP